MNKPILLYVEDDEVIVNDVLFFINRFFSKIVTASNGKDALESYKKFKPNLILLDINIPGLNGISLAKRIRQEDEEVPIIFLTAYSETNYLLSAIRIKVTSYIIKPFSIKELEDAISKTIRKYANEEKIFIDLKNGFCWYKELKELYCNNELIKLTKNERLIIEFLINNQGDFFSSTRISEILFFNSDTLINGNNIVQLISRLKNKLKKRFGVNAFFIETLYGEGYRIN